jgi:hypothetical protein
MEVGMDAGLFSVTSGAPLCPDHCGAGPLQNPGSPGVKTLVSKLHTPASPALSAKVLKVALDTKSISLIAASRHDKMQDRKGSGSRSCCHLLEDAGLDCRDLKPSATPDSSLADRRWPCASPCGDRPVDRKARRKQPPSLIRHARPVGDTLAAHWGVARMAGDRAQEGPG